MNVTTAETNTKNNEYFEKRYEALTSLNKAMGLINTVLHYGFDSNTLTEDEISDIKTQVQEIGTCLFCANDYIGKVADLLENG
jgi:hypothetical protein